MLLSRDLFGRLCRSRELLEHSLAVRDIAQQARISPFHFIRQFEAVFGLTPHQYRIQQRLDRAKLLLAKGEHSVTEVCMEIGFTSLGSFSDLFARRVGESPSSYRRRARVMVAIPGVVPQALFPGCLSLMAKLPPTAFRNFREATLPEPWLQCGLPLGRNINEDQTDQHHGARSGQGAEVLHGCAGFSQEA
jgi:AraC-like DNA-binding protein